MNLLKEQAIAKVDKLRQAAQNYDCVLCGKDKRFTVGAHSNSLNHGRGEAYKTKGCMIAYVCGDPGGCHDKIDGRSGGLMLEEKRALWAEAFARTARIWFRDGLVEVK